MKRYLQVLIALLFPLWLLGCDVAPFVTGNPAIKSPDKTEVVSMCYHANATTREEVRALAAKECTEEGSTVTFWHHDTTLNDCPILAKTRVSFLCVPPTAQPK
jgi:hypothetical protein